MSERNRRFSTSPDMKGLTRGSNMPTLSPRKLEHQKSGVQRDRPMSFYVVPTEESRRQCQEHTQLYSGPRSSKSMQEQKERRENLTRCSSPTRLRTVGSFSASSKSLSFSIIDRAARRRSSTCSSTSDDLTREDFQMSCDLRGVSQDKPVPSADLTASTREIQSPFWPDFGCEQSLVEGKHDAAFKRIFDRWLLMCCMAVYAVTSIGIMLQAPPARG